MKHTKGFEKERVDGNYVYYASVELSSKQIAVICFTQQLKYKEYLFTISFKIVGKKKHVVDEAVTTGRCGLEGLIWAKRKILEFEKWLLTETWRSSCDKPIKFEIKWADQRRRRVYIWGLSKCGYRYDPGQKRLLKVINKKVR